MPTKRILVRLLPLALLIPLTACWTSTPTPTPKATVLALESGLTTADGLAMNYAALPPCAGTNAPLCRDPAAMATIKAKAQTAYTAITAAQDAVDAGTDATSLLSSATAALAALQAAAATLPKGAVQ